MEEARRCLQAFAGSHAAARALRTLNVAQSEGAVVRHAGVVGNHDHLGLIAQCFDAFLIVAAERDESSGCHSCDPHSPAAIADLL